MRRKLIPFAAVLALLFLGAADCSESKKANRDNNIVHSKNPDPPAGAWKDFADVVSSIKYVCDLFRYNTDEQLVKPSTQGAVAQAASRDGVPADFVKLVGQYYAGNVAPDTAAHKESLRIYRGRLTEWCNSNGV